MLGEYRGTRIEDRDMQKQNVIRTVHSTSRKGWLSPLLRTGLFALFFSVGAAALSGSLLCGDLARYYRNKQLLKTSEQYLSKLKSLNTDYDVLLRQLKNDPNLIKRIAPATLGIEPEVADSKGDENTIYPKLTNEQLAAARKALEKESIQYQNEPAVPGWLTRCSEPRHRIILFFAGAGLILTSFACFAPTNKPQNE
jgi:hypothetical protein